MDELSNEKFMTVQEVAEILGVSGEAIKWHIRKLFPEILENGKTTYLNDSQVTEIKRYMIPTNQLVGSNTEKEMAEMTLKVIQYHIQKRKEIEEKYKKLIHNGKLYTTTEIAKELNMKSPQELNDKLEIKNVQYKINNTWVLTSRYSNLGYESIKQMELENGQIIYDRKWTGLGRDFILSLFK